MVSCVSDSREAKSQSGPGVVSQRVCAWCAPPLVTHGTRRGMGSRECRTRACGATILCCIEKGNAATARGGGRAPASWVPVLVQLPTAPQSLRRVIVHWDVNAEMQSGAHGRQSHLQREPGACLHSTRCRLGCGCRPGVSGLKDQSHLWPSALKMQSSGQGRTASLWRSGRDLIAPG